MTPCVLRLRFAPLRMRTFLYAIKEVPHPERSAKRAVEWAHLVDAATVSRALKSACLVALLLLPLAACGKKGPLEPPPDAPKTQYPKVYPSE
jgi:predicted small lipoprotein YifL